MSFAKHMGLSYSPPESCLVTPSRQFLLDKPPLLWFLSLYIEVYFFLNVHINGNRQQFMWGPFFFSQNMLRFFCTTEVNHISCSYHWCTCELFPGYQHCEQSGLCLSVELCFYLGMEVGVKSLELVGLGASDFFGKNVIHWSWTLRKPT